MTNDRSWWNTRVLPPGIEADESSLGPGSVREIAAALRSGQVDLAAMPWREVAARIGAAAENLLDPGHTSRAEALEGLGETAGLSSQMAEAVLDGMARDWCTDRLVDTVEAEPYLADALDGVTDGPGGAKVRARGRQLTLHIGAGTVPGIGATSLIRALLVKSAVWLKPGRGDVAIPVVLARSLIEADPVLARTLAVTYWPADALPDQVLQVADLVVAYGSNETIGALRRALPPTTPLVAYHHRLGLGAVAREALQDPEAVRHLADEVANAVAMFDQKGCVSPHTLFVERGGAVAPEEWCAVLADAMDAAAVRLPPGRLSAGEASAVQQMRGTAELKAAVDPTVRVFAGRDLSWTVLLDSEGDMASPCLARTVRLKPVHDLEELPDLLRPIGSVLQSVGFAGPHERAARLAESLSKVGVTRVCGFRQQPFPPPWWRHDGAQPLTPLVRWTELDL